MLNVNEQNTDTRIGNNYNCKFVPHGIPYRKNIKFGSDRSIVLVNYHYHSKYMLLTFNIIDKMFPNKMKDIILYNLI
jgi:hypothetical protein